ncbi:MAG: hypothetical protein U0641_18075 [Anaerolineae bacterium]
MAALIALSIDKTYVNVRPGASTELLATIQNRSAQLDQPALRVEGVDPNWVEIVPPAVLVFAQGQATARIIFHPPAAVEGALAGAYPVRITALSREKPGEAESQTAELRVERVGAWALDVTPGEARGTPDATYQVSVRNKGNALLTLNLRANDSANALFAVFNPFALSVPAGEAAQATLSVRPRRANTDGRRLTVTITGEGQFHLHNSPPAPAPPVSATTQYVLPEAAALALDVSPLQIEDTSGGQFRIQVGNPGWAPVTVTLTASDADGHIGYRFDPPRLTLGPQTTDYTTLYVTVKTPSPADGPRDDHIRVAATPEGAPEQAVWQDVVLHRPAVRAARRQWPCSFVAVGLLLLLLASLRLITLLW